MKAEYALKIIVVTILLAGCTRYTLPIKTEHHPSSTHAPISKIELSTLLDLKGDHEGN